MHAPVVRRLCRRLRKTYLATRSKAVAQGNAIRTYPRAMSLLVTKDRMAIAAVRVAPTFSTLRNSSGPTPTNRASYPRATASDNTQRSGISAVKIRYSRGRLGQPANRASRARSPAARAQMPSVAPAAQRYDFSHREWCDSSRGLTVQRISPARTAASSVAAPCRVASLATRPPSLPRCPRLGQRPPPTAFTKRTLRALRWFT